MKLLALVTLYYPPAHITDNLLTYAEDVDGLFVWDNTPGGSNYQFPESISHKIVRLRQGENTGIGKALNAAAMFALDNGYTYLLTMDQDSAFTASTFKDYIRIINNDKDSSHFAYIPLINASWHRQQCAAQRSTGDDYLRKYFSVENDTKSRSVS